MILITSLVRGAPTTVLGLSTFLSVPNLSTLLDDFLWQCENPTLDPDSRGDAVPLHWIASICIYNSAVAKFPSYGDSSGYSNMQKEHIWATPSWRSSGPQFDPIFVNIDPTPGLGMKGMAIARVLQFLKIKTVANAEYDCALVQWWTVLGKEPDDITGMWLTEPHIESDGPLMDIVHLDCVIRGAHLLPAFGSSWSTPAEFHFSKTLDTFKAYYINKYADHHAFTIAF
jgi:hypothetical protein